MEVIEDLQLMASNKVCLDSITSSSFNKALAPSKMSYQVQIIVKLIIIAHTHTHTHTLEHL